MYQWFQVEEALTSGMADRSMKEVEINGKLVVLLKADGSWKAFAATCPHAGARLCEWWLDARGRVVCPLHGYRFDPSNGRNTSGEGYKMRTYPVEVRDGLVFIGLMF